MVKKTCGQCAYWQYMGGTCPIFRRPVNSEEQACLSFVKQFQICQVCEKPTPDYFIDITEEEKPHIICLNCDKHWQMCPTCVNGNQCEFQTNPSPIPKTIRKQIQNGNMTMVTEVPNPERIRKLCQELCPCFDPENGCLKQKNSCEKWRVKYEEV